MLCPALKSLPVESILKETDVGFRMAKAEPPSASKDLQELPRRLSLLRASVQSSSQAVPFVKSPAGQDLHPHPVLTVSSLAFAAASAVPLGFFLLRPVLTALAASVGVMLLAGLAVSAGGLTALCPVWLGLCAPRHFRDSHMSLRVGSSLTTYWFSLRLLPQRSSRGDCPLAVKSAAQRGSAGSDQLNGAGGFIQAPLEHCWTTSARWNYDLEGPG